ncbi:hypothetical protein [Niallia sp. 03190]|uniref:hypothetical protein n=1 Tax=Niallia sp. 03190 TaxID=3458061 RepID=UPI0040444C41
MSELLTTGQMLDQLQPGEVAVPNDKSHQCIKRFEHHLFKWVDRNNHQPINLFHFGVNVNSLIDLKWRIVPAFVETGLDSNYNKNIVSLD